MNNILLDHNEKQNKSLIEKETSEKEQLLKEVHRLLAEATQKMQLWDSAIEQMNYILKSKDMSNRRK